MFEELLKKLLGLGERQAPPAQPPANKQQQASAILAARRKEKAAEAAAVPEYGYFNPGAVSEGFGAQVPLHDPMSPAGKRALEELRRLFPGNQKWELSNTYSNQWSKQFRKKNPVKVKSNRVDAIRAFENHPNVEGITGRKRMSPQKLDQLDKGIPAEVVAPERYGQRTL